ncbi:hypothetical protein GOBAR_AA30049 [Gossypium barbadense]|uniref:Amine oxidase domain-containing protein n=1 Tax=Gossypium barbadense TaxID=3634 RepID=A0A2P5WHS5_GOSBA|nr:hypothetical protein GOBAR_AA30049 [Gossypium barbadense]
MESSDKSICYPNGARRPVRIPSVIVIGAGMAGIAAARALHEASFQVTVLESRDRIGGRVHTDYSFGFPVDLGASWLHGVSKENPLAPLISRLGLPLYRTSGDNSVLYDHDLESYALFDMDGHQVPQELVTKTNKVRQEHSEDMSISSAFSIVFERRPALRLQGLAHKVLQWYVCRMEGWFASDADTISLKSWDQAVTNIVRRYTGVKVTVEDGTTFAADAVIVAVPLGVLKAKTIKFEPRLPEWKEAAIDELGVGIENKIILHFDKVFWPNVEFLGVVADTSYHCSYFLNLHKATGHSVLVYMPAGQLARDIEKMSDEAAVEFAFMQLKKILPEAWAPEELLPGGHGLMVRGYLPVINTLAKGIDIRLSHIQYLVSRWGTDVNTLGSYSYDAVGMSHDLYERLRVPVDNIFFAGEATSMSYPGSIHGAFSTGQMAAEDCRMRVLERYGELNLLQPVMGEEAGLCVPLLITRL